MTILIDPPNAAGHGRLWSHLASDPARYAEYAADVRREYAHVDDADFRRGRDAVLRDLLAKPRLFHTAYAFEHWEAPARANVERELAAL
jgi:predicted metal-dependent HD superfamily phosphohydrolase